MGGKKWEGVISVLQGGISVISDDAHCVEDFHHKADTPHAESDHNRYPAHDLEEPLRLDGLLRAKDSSGSKNSTGKNMSGQK